VTPAGALPHEVAADLAVLVSSEHKAKGFHFLPRQPVDGALSGRHASHLRGRGLSFEELRRYVPGDDVRTIDWRVTARTRKPHVRVYGEERDRPSLLVVDQRRSMFFGSRRAMKSVVAAEVAALGAWRVLSVGDRVGALVFDDVGTQALTPRRSRRQVLALLRALVEGNRALANAAERGPSDPAKLDPTQLDRALERACQLASHDHLVTVISDFHGLSDTTERLLARLKRHNDVLLIPVVDALEASLPDAGRLVVGRGGDQLEVDAGDHAVRQRFAASHAARLEAIASLAGPRTPVLFLDTEEDVASQVRRALGHRPRGGSGS
jgi:uncharacterized protein (DUF58 family)